MSSLKILIILSNVLLFFTGQSSVLVPWPNHDCIYFRTRFITSILIRSPYLGQVSFINKPFFWNVWYHMLFTKNHKAYKYNNYLDKWWLFGQLQYYNKPTIYNITINFIIVNLNIASIESRVDWHRPVPYRFRLTQNTTKHFNTVKLCLLLKFLSHRQIIIYNIFINLTSLSKVFRLIQEVVSHTQFKLDYKFANC